MTIMIITILIISQVFSPGWVREVNHDHHDHHHHHHDHHHDLLGGEVGRLLLMQARPLIWWLIMDEARNSTMKRKGNDDNQDEKNDDNHMLVMMMTMIMELKSCQRNNMWKYLGGLVFVFFKIYIAEDIWCHPGQANISEDIWWHIWWKYLGDQEKEVKRLSLSQCRLSQQLN